MSRTLRSLASLAVYILTIVAIHEAWATQAYLSIPSITGEDPVPGYPGAMEVDSLSIISGGFSVIRKLDSTSIEIAEAVANGTPLGPASVLVYNGAPAIPADATLLFPNIYGIDYQLLVGGDEEVSFASPAQMTMFLEIPGIPGESSTPGHPNVMQIESFTLTDDNFSVVKAVDSASPDIVLAVANGTLFSTASVLFYDSVPAVGPPAVALVFHDVLGSSYELLINGDAPQREQDTFNFASISQPIPEPASIVLIMCSCVPLTFVRQQTSVSGSRRP